MNFLKNAINKNLQWFIRSGVMIPDNGLWGVAERLAVKSGNQALEKTLEAFPAWTDQEECYTIEQRRADCNFQTAWLFLLADKLFPGANYGEIGRNISDFLYFRSGLLERNKNVPVPGNWNWSHIMRDNRIWFDDQSWCLFIQLKIAGEFPELDKKYRMTHWAGLLAESLYTALSDANARTHWNGNPDHPNWGALATMALAQAAICYLVAIPLGLTVSFNIFYAVLGIIPMAVFNIALGLLCGSILGVKQVGGLCGALLTNLSAWFSGVWFDLDLVGGLFRKIANCLPFVHASELEKALFSGNFDAAMDHILPVAAYAVLVTAVAVACFLRQMNRQ